MSIRSTIAFVLFAAATTAVLQAQSAPATPASAQTPKVAPVTTTVVVKGESKDEYLPDAVVTGLLDPAPVQQTPLSISLVSHAVLSDQIAHLLTDVIKNDASIGEDYAPVGYYGSFQIRGIPIDLATGFKINGLTIAGEQDVPLENKETVEFVKGLAGVESGVASAGGLVSFVTKRPVNIKALDTATDQRGSSYGSADLGHIFGSHKQVGTRLNIAGEHMLPYVQHTEGWRGVGAAATDWRISPNTTLLGDFEYQHKLERSVCGYQLLGDHGLPDINRLFPSHMLGYQSWMKPNTFDTWNASSRLIHEFSKDWRAQAAGSLSHSLIDDNVVYAYGNSLNNPYSNFAPDGTYDIYDYRNPGELRINGVAQATVNGRLHTGPLTHEVTAGGELFLRNVRTSGGRHKNDPSWVVDGSIYAWIGSENIYQTDQAFAAATDPATGHALQAGPRALKDDNHQSSLLLQDRVLLPHNVKLIAGGRYDSLRDHNFSGSTNTDRNLWLPQYAATWNPASSVMLYGNYGVVLSLGPQAPWWVSNANAYLAPIFTRQVEAGAKIVPNQRMLVTAAWFRMTTPNIYSRTLKAADAACPAGSAGDLCFEIDGREIHNGVELSAEGKAASWLRLTGTLTAMSATGNNTSDASANGKQIINQPHLRSSIFADLALPHAHGLHLLPGWGFTGVKQATRDNLTSVPAYNLFNLGARYTMGGEKGHLTLRAYADNIGNKRYWSDTGASYGDTFLHIGAPTTVRLMAHYTF